MKKWLKWISGIIVLKILFLNGIAILQAYHFTHYSEDEIKTDVEKLSLIEKGFVFLTGIKNPRPENKTLSKSPFEEIQIIGRDTISAWYIPNTDTISNKTIVIFHGYGGEKSSQIEKVNTFTDLGFNVLLVDFIGSGNSKGNEVTLGYKESEDVHSVYQYLKKQNQKIHFYGTSMGAVAIMKAVVDYDLEIESLILACPFASMLDAVENRFEMVHAPKFPLSHLLVFWGGVLCDFNAFSHQPTKYAPSISCPTLLLRGALDQRVKSWETDSIYTNIKSSNKKLVTLPNSDHVEFLKTDSLIWTNEVHNFYSNFQ